MRWCTMLLEPQNRRKMAHFIAACGRAYPDIVKYDVCYAMEWWGEVLGKVSHKKLPQKDDKSMLGNIGDLFVKFMRQVTKGYLYHLLGVSGYYVMYRHRA